MYETTINIVLLCGIIIINIAYLNTKSFECPQTQSYINDFALAVQLNAGRRGCKRLELTVI